MIPVQVHLAIYGFALVVSLIGWAVFAYAMKTERLAARGHYRQLVAAFVLAVALSVGVGLVKEADCNEWWAQGDYYRWVLHQCYVFGR